MTRAAAAGANEHGCFPEEPQRRANCAHLCATCYLLKITSSVAASLPRHGGVKPPLPLSYRVDDKMRLANDRRSFKQVAQRYAWLAFLCGFGLKITSVSKACTLIGGQQHAVDG